MVKYLPWTPIQGHNVPVVLDPQRKLGQYMYLEVTVAIAPLFTYKFPLCDSGYS